MSAIPSAAQPKAETLPPEPTAAHKRQMDFHVTAYPSQINRDLLPERALETTDFSSIDPLQYRKNHKIANNNVSSTVAGVNREPGLQMMSTSHLASHFMLMGQEMSKNPTGNMKAMMPRGFYTRYTAPPFDERSTYRLDYCQSEPSGFHNASKVTLANYRNNWSNEEKDNIDVSKDIPYLTLPESHCKNRTTMYRFTQMPNAKREEFRTISQQINLPDLGTSFAYSAYGVDDPRRAIQFDPKIASLKRPKSFLEKTDDDIQYDPKEAQAVHDELERMRALRRSTSVGRDGEMQSVEDITSSIDKPIIIPGVKGAGYRRAPKNNAEYVFLPRDFFCHGSVQDL